MATWSEEMDEIAPRAALTERARAEICRRVAEAGQSVAEVARDFGVGWHTTMAAVRDHGHPRVDPCPASGLLAPQGWMTTHSYRALSSTRRCRRPGSLTWTATGSWMWSKAAPRKGFQLARSATGAVAAAIGTVTLDPYAAYARGLAEGLPHADLVGVPDPPPAAGGPGTLAPGRVGPHPGRARGEIRRRGRCRLPRQRTPPRVVRRHSEQQARRRLEHIYARCRNADIVELRGLAAMVRRWE